jgi:hypothetical protein
MLMARKVDIDTESHLKDCVMGKGLAGQSRRRPTPRQRRLGARLVINRMAADQTTWTIQQAEAMLQLFFLAPVIG